jgi:hypothetical protein
MRLTARQLWPAADRDRHRHLHLLGVLIGVASLENRAPSPEFRRAFAKAGKTAVCVI